MGHYKKMTYGVLGFVGGNEWGKDCTFDQRLLEVSGASEVLVLPTAAAYEYPMRVIQNATNYFDDFGVTTKGLMVLSHDDANDRRNAQTIAQAKFIYLSGGSPLHLRSVLKESLCFGALRDAWQNGATLIGSSAGGMVLTDPMVDPRGGAFTLGLGLVKKFAFSPHYSEWSQERRKRTHLLEGSDFVTVGVDEQTALIRWSNGEWEVLGKGSAEAYYFGKEISLGDLEYHIEIP